MKNGIPYFIDTIFFVKEIKSEKHIGENIFKDGGNIIFDPKKLPSLEKFKFAERIRAYYPKVWFLGGNTIGNKMFYHLRNVIKRGYWLHEEEWIYKKWQAYHAQHHKDYRIVGIVAMLKWLGDIDDGWAYMKEEIMKEVRNRYPDKTQFLPLSESAGGVKVSRMKEGGIINDIGGYDYNENEQKIAKKVDLITLPKSVEGTNCSNCLYVQILDAKKGLGFCTHKDILLPVTAKMCCALWNNKDAERSWKK